LSEYVKAVYLLRFAENVEWNEAHNSSVKIALFDVDSTLIRGLYSLAKIRFSENNPYQFYQSSSLDDLLSLNPQVVYISPDNSFLLKRMYQEFEKRSILLVTDDLPSLNYSMVNFYKKEGMTISYALNMENIQASGLSLKPKLTAFGDAELDIRKKYLDKEEELAVQRIEMDRQKKVIKTQDSIMAFHRYEISKQFIVIDSQKNVIDQQDKGIKLMVDSLKLLSGEVNKKSLELSSVEDGYLMQKSLLNSHDIQLHEQTQKLKSGELVLKQLEEEIGSKLNEIKKQNELLKDLQKSLHAQRNYLILLLITIGMFILVTGVIIKAFRFRKKINQELREKNKGLQGALKELQQTQLKLVQTEKMASLGTLTAGVAHEINNPLNFIMGSYYGLVQYFEDKGECDELTCYYLSTIKEGVDRSVEIVRALEQFSEHEDSKPEDCRISEVLDNCILMVNDRLKAQIELHKNYLENDFSVNARRSQMHQVFYNIISNGLDAINDQGIINICTETNGSWFYVKIEDNGVGIDDMDLKFVTDPFFTTKDPGKGTGLGLYIAQSCINELEGNIQITSRKGEGTIVSVGFPMN